MRHLFPAACALLLILAALLVPESPGRTAGEAAPKKDVSKGLRVVDWLIICVYASGTIGLGWFYSRRQKSTQEYFVGSGSMNPLLVGVSLFATLLSSPKSGL